MKINVYTPLEQIKPRWKDLDEYLEDSWSILTEGQKKNRDIDTYEFEDDNGNIVKISMPIANILWDYMHKNIAVKNWYEFLQLAEKIRCMDWFECRCEERQPYRDEFIIHVPCPVCGTMVKVIDPVGVGNIHKTYDGGNEHLNHLGCRGMKRTNIPIWYKRISEDKVLVKFLEWYLPWKEKDL
jgi:hypothetical protein